MEPMVFIFVLLTVCLFYSFALGSHLSQAPINGRKAEDTWRREAIQKLWDERKDMSYTPITHLAIPGMPDVDIIFKNESASRTGNLKHRFSWALFMWALIEGYIGKNTTIYEASSGNTASSEAYMARLIGVPFVAVVPNTTEDKKLERVVQYDGRFIKTEIGKNFDRAQLEAQVNNGFYMNQFSNADKAEEFHQSNGNSKESTNVFHEILCQLNDEKVGPPHFFVHSAGTGGTISSVGRYVKKYLIPTEVVLADSEFSIYYDYVVNQRFKREGGEPYWVSPGMAGTGFGYSGPAMHGKTTSLQPSVIDLAFKVPDLASTAAMHFLKKIGISGGTSTGLNFITALSLAAQRRTNSSNNDTLRIVVLLADSSAPYEDTYFNFSWISEKFHSHGGIPLLKCWERAIEHSYKHVPNTTEDKKLERVVQYDGRFIKTEIGKNFDRAQFEAQVNNGFYMNQFSNADKAEEFHQSNGNSKESTNVFHEILCQLNDEKVGPPHFFVHSAGTGGTMSSVGRYVKKYLIPTAL